MVAIENWLEHYEVCTRSRPIQRFKNSCEHQIIQTNEMLLLEGSLVSPTVSNIYVDDIIQLEKKVFCEVFKWSKYYN